MADIARWVFDRCTILTGEGDEFLVVFHFEFLDDTLHFDGWSASNKLPKGTPYIKNTDKIKKNHPLMLMVKNKREELLDHPLVSALLKRKWFSVGLVFYLLNLMLYLLFLTMLTGFALDIKAPYQFTDISTDGNICFEEEEEATQEGIPQFAAFAKYCVIILAAIELLIEILQMILMCLSNVTSYLKEMENYSEWIACIFSILFVVNTSGCTDTGYRPQWQWTCGTISVFLAWINLVLLIQKFDFMGIYVLMLCEISKVFMKFFLVFSLLIVAFAVAFHCLLQNQEPFSTFWISLVKTTEMMIGELDYSTIFLDGKVHYNAISHVFFYIFMLFMSIILLNTMTGLAVDDIRNFRLKAGLKRKKMQIEFALEMEKLSSRIFPTCFRKKDYYCIAPNEEGWFGKKILESWKLTEKDIKEALHSGT
ncbi:transient receptor potential cation channel subfamily A member 1 homolog, partial [Mercenaria mercenaria]|uniref:transient receptor potential cation channel subfamily A member 1 homolog n=1 Tax=Mercenaria mercenaria TaxID=6596 RepID=UPI00234F83DF